MGPENPLPLPSGFADAELYVESLLNFGTSSQILHTLCGGVHILDFLTRKPDFYSVILPYSWRKWFADVEVHHVLDLLMREDLSQFGEASEVGKAERTWRRHRIPPRTLVDYISRVRTHLLNREFKPPASDHDHGKLNRHVFMGMNPKKVHEVDNFAMYMDHLASNIETHNKEKISHLADFGAGQNYLGRVLASVPYKRHIIAIESRSHVVEGAKNLDVLAKVTEKPAIRRNKKAYRAAKANQEMGLKGKKFEKARVTCDGNKWSEEHGDRAAASMVNGTQQGQAVGKAKREVMVTSIEGNTQIVTTDGTEAAIEIPSDGKGTIQYIEHCINNGDLASVINHIKPPASLSLTKQQSIGDTMPETTTTLSNTTVPPTSPPLNTSSHQQDHSLMVISLHSCGNLVHHGLRTLTLNPTVKAVALVGCCYNLMTERLGPPTHKLHLRSDHPRLDAAAGARDSNGFPMSERFARYKHRMIPRPDFSSVESDTCADTELNSRSGAVGDDMLEGVRLNITARMMAVQAPQNWTEAESSSFFAQHFFRALLQRIFLDKGVVRMPPSDDKDDMGCSPAGSSWGLADGDGSKTAPVVIGKLKKKCYQSFTSYVRGAVKKLSAGGGEVARVVEEKVGSMSDDEIQEYESRYQARKKDLSIVWSLMAFSAGIVEAMIVVDRWLWLKEQPCVKHAWVEPVFDYVLSPRNLVVVGIK
jgi:hypothetical protein